MVWQGLTWLTALSCNKTPKISLPLSQHLNQHIRLIKHLLFLLLLSSFLPGYAQREQLKHTEYKTYKLDFYSFANLKKSNQVKYSISIGTDSMSSRYNILLRRLPKNSGQVDFDYILMVEDNVNYKNSRPLYNYKYQDPVALEQLEKDIQALLDRNLSPDTAIRYADEKLKAKLLGTSKNYIALLCKNDLAGFAQGIHPLILQNKTYAEKGEELQALFDQRTNYKYLAGVPLVKSDFVKYNGELQCVVFWNFEVMANGQKQKNEMRMIAASPDEGKTWYFTDIMPKDVRQYDAPGLSYNRPKFANSLLEILQKNWK